MFGFLLWLLVGAMLLSGLYHLSVNFPSESDQKFNQECSALDGKDPRIEEIIKIESKCYSGGRYEKCDENEIKKFIDGGPSRYMIKSGDKEWITLYAPEGFLEDSWTCTVYKSETQFRTNNSLYFTD